MHRRRKFCKKGCYQPLIIFYMRTVHISYQIYENSIPYHFKCILYQRVLSMHQYQYPNLLLKKIGVASYIKYGVSSNNLQRNERILCKLSAKQKHFMSCTFRVDAQFCFYLTFKYFLKFYCTELIKVAANIMASLDFLYILGNNFAHKNICKSFFTFR